MAKGWTFTELMIVIALISIIVCFSLPMLSMFRQNNQERIIVNDLLEGINVAKTYAATSNAKIWLTHDAKQKDWSAGFLLMTQENTSKVTLQQWDWSNYDTQVLWHGFKSKDSLIFAQNLQHSAVNGYFLVKNKTRTIKLIVNRIGRVRVESL